MKQSERTEQTREKIIAAATEEFGRAGYIAASLNHICSTHSIPKGLIYHNFKGKDALYLSCVSRCFLTVTDYLRGQSKAGDLKQYLNLRYHFFLEYPLYARIFFEAILQPPAHLKDEIYNIRQNFDALNREIYCAALQHLTLRSGVTEIQALQYFELMQEMFNGYFSRSAYAASDFSDLMAEHESRLNDMLNLMLYGIAKEGT